MNEESTSQKVKRPRSFRKRLFWGSNIVLLLFTLAGFGFTTLPEIADGVFSGVLPVHFLIYAAILVIIPQTTMLTAYIFLRNSPERLVALLYTVEAPLMLILWICIAVLPQPTAAMRVLLTSLVLGILTYLWQILDQHIPARQPWLRDLHMAGLTLLLIITLYACVWVSFYAVPITSQFAIGLRESLLHALREPLFFTFNLLLFFLPIAITLIFLWLLGTLPLGMLVVFPSLSIRAWLRSLREAKTNGHLLRNAAVSTVTLGLFLAVFVWANLLQQPQQKAFALLETSPSSPAEIQALLDQEQAVRTGLVNAYLAPSRYAGAVGNSYNIRQMYVSAFHLSDTLARRVQQLYELVARPVLYMPSRLPDEDEAYFWWKPYTMEQDAAKAAALYEQFFDQNIEEGERRAIVDAVRATSSAETALAAWQEVDDREVYIAQQNITVNEHGDWAEVELFEVYQNQTYQRQEVVYYFSLPESAAITGIWLGYTPERDKRFAYFVATRGAAQEVYRSEVQRKVDPALIEQIGPCQYRLRIFPVDARRQYDEQPMSLYFWMTWRVMAVQQPKNAWPMLALSHKVNVYWDENTVRLVNGAHMQMVVDSWMPPYVPAQSPIQASAHRVDFPDGRSLIARPVEADALQDLPDGLRLAVVLDRSHSMAQHANEVDAALKQLDEAAAQGSSIDVDVYLTASEYRGEQPAIISLDQLDPHSLQYFGGQNAAELLAQYQLLHTDQVYDAILVLTDASGYELGQSAAQITAPEAALWIVHMGHEFSPGYDDATLEAIQASHGGVVGSIEEALVRLAVSQRSVSDGERIDVLDGYEWTTYDQEHRPPISPEDDLTTAVDPAFAPLAARQLILTTLQNQRDQLNDLQVLDGLHHLAQENSVLTPYSSMIVLVNERQEKLLNELEEGSDRFEREQEGVGETPTSPDSPAPNVTGVPEPEEWLLILTGLALLVWYVYKNPRMHAELMRISTRN